MSTIVVVKKNGLAVIAGDTRFTHGDDTVCDARYKANHDKIHTCGDTYIGAVGSTTHHDVIQSLIESHPQELSFRNRREIFKTYLKIHQRLKKEFYVLTDEDDNEQPYESSQITALLANPHGIFEMFSYREVTEYNRFWAIGSGADFALGALCAVYDRHRDPREIARVGVAAAAEFDSATALPMTLYAVELKKTGKPKGSRARRA